jgi:hypothetical protein
MLTLTSYCYIFVCSASKQARTLVQLQRRYTELRSSQSSQRGISREEGKDLHSADTTGANHRKSEEHQVQIDKHVEVIEATVEPMFADSKAHDEISGYGYPPLQRRSGPHIIGTTLSDGQKDQKVTEKKAVEMKSHLERATPIQLLRRSQSKYVKLRGKARQQKQCQRHQLDYSTTPASKI